KHYQTLATWDLKTGKLLARHPVELGRNTALAPAGRAMLSLPNTGGAMVSSPLLISPASGKELVRLETPRNAGGGEPFAFSPDGRRLATGNQDSTVLLWDLGLPAPEKCTLAARERDALWADLLDTDASKAWQAVWRLAASPEVVVPWLGERVKPVPHAAA